MDVNCLRGCNCFPRVDVQQKNKFFKQQQSGNNKVNNYRCEIGLRLD